MYKFVEEKNNKVYEDNNRLLGIIPTYLRVIDRKIFSRNVIYIDNKVFFKIYF